MIIGTILQWTDANQKLKERTLGHWPTRHVAL